MQLCISLRDVSFCNEHANTTCRCSGVSKLWVGSSCQQPMTEAIPLPLVQTRIFESWDICTCRRDQLCISVDIPLSETGHRLMTEVTDITAQVKPSDPATQVSATRFSRCNICQVQQQAWQASQKCRLARRSSNTLYAEANAPAVVQQLTCRAVSPAGAAKLLHTYIIHHCSPHLHLSNNTSVSPVLPGCHTA